MESGSGKGRDRLHGWRLMRWSVTARPSRLGWVRTILPTVLVVVVIVIIVCIPRSLFRIGMAQLRMRRIGTSSLLRSSWSAIVTCGINWGDVIFRGISLLSSRTAITATVTTTDGSGCRLRWGLTHLVCGDRLSRSNTREDRGWESAEAKTVDNSRVEYAMSRSCLMCGWLAGWLIDWLRRSLVSGYATGPKRTPKERSGRIKMVVGCMKENIKSRQVLRLSIKQSLFWWRESRLIWPWLYCRRKCDVDDSRSSNEGEQQNKWRAEASGLIRVSQVSPVRLSAKHARSKQWRGWILGILSTKGGSCQRLASAPEADVASRSLAFDQENLIIMYYLTHVFQLSKIFQKIRSKLKLNYTKLKHLNKSISCA